jgi:tetratricopeptide (TPR) repeat protein
LTFLKEEKLLMNLGIMIFSRCFACAALLFVVCSTSSNSSFAESPPTEGESLILKAHALSNTAASEEQYTRVIDLCRQASEHNLSAELVRYNNQLRSWAQNRRGEVRIKQGDLAGAATDFEVAVALVNNSWRALYNRALCSARQRQYDRALADLDKVLKLKGQFAAAYFHRGEVRRELGQFSKARADFDVYIDSRPDDPEAYAARGHVLFQLGQRKSGVADLYSALKLDSRCVSALVYRGEAFCELGYFDKAARDFRAAIEIDADSGRAYRSAAWLMATCPDENFQNGPLAVEAARKAVELAGDKPSIRELDTLAAAEANQGDFDAAKKTLVAAMKLASNTERELLASRLELYQQEKPYRIATAAKPEKIAEQAAGEVEVPVEGPELQ